MNNKRRGNIKTDGQYDRFKIKNPMKYEKEYERCNDYLEKYNDGCYEETDFVDREDVEDTDDVNKMVLKPIKETNRNDIFGDNTVFKMNSTITDEMRDYVDSSVVDPILSLFPVSSINLDQLGEELATTPERMGNTLIEQRYHNDLIAYVMGRIAQASTSMLLEYLTQCDYMNAVGSHDEALRDMVSYVNKDMK